MRVGILYFINIYNNHILYVTLKVINLPFDTSVQKF